jgi:hypothetical protein
VASSQPSQQRIGDFYLEVVLPALATRLDSAFPEFGWKPDARDWVATNEEMTHRVLGVRAERVVAHGPAPRGFLVHGGDATLWTAYLNGGIAPRGEAFASVVRELAARAGVDTAPIDRAQPRDRTADLLRDFFTLCRSELHGQAGTPARVSRAPRLPGRRDRPGRPRRRPRRALQQERAPGRGLLGTRARQSGLLADGPLAGAALRRLARRARHRSHPVGALAPRRQLLHPLPLPPRRQPRRAPALRPVRRSPSAPAGAPSSCLSRA